MSRSRSRSSSSSSSSSSSDSEERRRRRKEKKKRKKEKKKLKKERKGKDVKKKDKKKKAKKLKKARELQLKKQGHMGAVTNQFGKFGVLTDADLYRKRPEFQLWCTEIKNVAYEGLSQMEEKRLFKDFIEDHNTATFPSKKYYDLETWDKNESKRMAASKIKEPQVMTTFDDEKNRMNEIQQMREARKDQRLTEQVNALKHDRSMIDQMRNQEKLRFHMNALFKSGNIEEAEAIRRRIEPEKPK